ncbi:MAG: DUF4157 domain-containing protein [Bacteroidia bacterium]
MNSLAPKTSAVPKLFSPFARYKHFVQPKLEINQPGDQYEQEADAMADRVMRMPSNEPSLKPVTGLIGASVQRKCAECEEEEEKKKKPLMRKAEAGYSGIQASPSLATSLNASKGGGTPLPQGTRSFMENAFNTDFSSVRVHADTQASEMSKGINAKAFTYGSDIYFNHSQYNPETSEGKKLLTHELAHTIQQNLASDKIVQKKDEPFPTAMFETITSLFPFSKGNGFVLSQLFPDSLFGYEQNQISNWVKGVQELKVIVEDINEDTFRVSGSDGVKNVSILVDRIGSERFQIKVFSDEKLQALQELRPIQYYGRIVLSPIGPNLQPLSGSNKPLSPVDKYAKSDEAPLLGLEGTSNLNQSEKVVTVEQPKTQDDINKENIGKATESLDKLKDVIWGYLKNEGIIDEVTQRVEKIPIVYQISVPVTLVGTALLGLIATKTESPITKSPEITLPKMGSVKMKFNITYKGPANNPSEVSIELTFALGSLEVVPKFKIIRRDLTDPNSLYNSSGIGGFLSLTVPLGTDPSKKTESTATDNARAELEELREQENKYKSGIAYKAGTPESKEAEIEKKAIENIVKKQFQPGLSAGTDASLTSPQILQSFDVGEGADKKPWNMELLSNLINAAFVASPHGTIKVIAIYDSVLGDSLEHKMENSKLLDAANNNAYNVKQALSQWIPKIKDHIETSVIFKGSGQTFGLAADIADQIGTRDVTVIFTPKGSI